MLINDLFINSYYPLWTSFWYLPTFLLTSFGIMLINSLKNGTGHTWLLIGVLSATVAIHYQGLNPYNYLLNNSGANFNTLLFNSINKFHPALFYVAVSYLLASSQPLIRYQQGHYTLNANSLWSAFIGNLFTEAIMITLFLGSWWALQEGSWGGWWNWDPSEVFGLLVLLYYLYTLHKFQKPNNYTILISHLQTIIRVILTVYMFIQLNFDLVSHNFGTKVNYFLDTSQNFSTSLIYLLVVIGLTIYELRYKLNTNILRSPCSLTYRKKLTLAWHVAASSLITLVLLSSFALLINDFLWSLLMVNLFNSAKFNYLYTSLLITIVLIRSWNLQPCLLPLLACPLYLSKEFLLFTSIPINTKDNLLHVIVTSWLFVIVSESNQSISFWNVLHENLPYKQFCVTYDIGKFFISLNNFTVERVSSVLANNESVELIWNFLWTASSHESHSFLHTITTNLVNQVLRTGSSLSNYVIDVSDFWIGTNNWLLTSSLLLVRCLLKTCKLITS